MIKINKIDDGLPISVIVPLSEKREKFFYEYVYPLIEINNPNDIINNYKGLAPKKEMSVLINQLNHMYFFVMMIFCYLMNTY